MEQTEHFGLALIMYACTVFLVHLHSGVYGNTNCSSTKCTLTVFFEREGDAPCNKDLPETTLFCYYDAPQIFWSQAEASGEYLILFVDAGPGGPWYCPPNDVMNYNWLTSAWFVWRRGLPVIMVKDNNIKTFRGILYNDFNKYREHTFYVLLYRVHTFKRTTFISTVLNGTVRDEIRRRVEANANISYILEPSKLKHPGDLIASYHFRFIYGRSCSEETDDTAADPSTTVPSTTRSESGAGYNNAAVIPCVCVMANMLWLFQ